MTPRKRKPRALKTDITLEVGVPLDLSADKPEIATGALFAYAATRLRASSRLPELRRRLELAALVLERLAQALGKAWMKKNKTTRIAEDAIRLHRTSGGKIRAACITALEAWKEAATDLAVDRVEREFHLLRAQRRQLRKQSHTLRQRAKTPLRPQ